jgi:hypothetical protein
VAAHGRRSRSQSWATGRFAPAEGTCIAITEDVYGHLVDAGKRAAADAMAAALIDDESAIGPQGRLPRARMASVMDSKRGPGGPLGLDDLPWSRGYGGRTKGSWRRAVTSTFRWPVSVR